MTSLGSASRTGALRALLLAALENSPRSEMQLLQQAARMTEYCIHRSNGHQIVTFDAPASVEDEYHQTFTFRIDLRFILHLIVLLLNSGFAPLPDGRNHLW